MRWAGKSDVFADFVGLKMADIHICGTCKLQTEDLQQFVEHKSKCPPRVATVVKVSLIVKPFISNQLLVKHEWSRKICDGKTGDFSSYGTRPQPYGPRGIVIISVYLSALAQIDPLSPNPQHTASWRRKEHFSMKWNEITIWYSAPFCCMQPQRCFTFYSSAAGLFVPEPSQLPGEYSATAHRI